LVTAAAVLVELLIFQLVTALSQQVGMLASEAGAVWPRRAVILILGRHMLAKLE
jgi:hypothetical protein